MDKIRKATHDGEITIGDITIPCVVLEDGTRLLSRISFIRAIGRKGKAKGGRAYDNEFKTPVFLTAKNLKPFISEDLIENSTPIQFVLNGTQSIGYKAELLPQVCGVFLDADDAEKLNKNQRHIAEMCKILIRGFAEVGIIALVDEATGYQEIRRKEALQAILDKYLRKELAVWAKRFPDEFYKEMFRLRGWQWKKLSVSRPSIVGKWTKDLVYERLAPGIIQELENRNPVIQGKKYRKDRHHQYLTDDIGHPALANHLYGIIGMMRASSTWDQFYRLVQRAYPKKDETLPLFSEY